MKTILIISPEQWTDHAVSKHHYARTLAEMGHTVLFLNPPCYAKSDIVITPVDDYDNLSIVQASQVAKGLRYYPSFIRYQLEKSWLERLEERFGQEIDVVWLFENSRFFNLRFAGNRLKIYHQVDLNQNFNHGEAAYTADICFCTTDYIKKELSPYNNRVYKIHHAVANFGKSEVLSSEQKKRISDSINVMYVGNLDLHYIDSELLIRIVKAHPEIKFHFVGKYKKDGVLHYSSKMLPNINWWGMVESKMIPPLLQEVDVLLCIYKAEYYKKQLASPHKIMEYLASGKTVVATYTDEYKDKLDLIEMVENNSDYPDAFDKVINNIKEYNSVDRQNKRIRFSLDNTYIRQIEKINNILVNNGLKGLV